MSEPDFTQRDSEAFEAMMAGQDGQRSYEQTLLLAALEVFMSRLGWKVVDDFQQGRLTLDATLAKLEQADTFKIVTGIE